MPRTRKTTLSWRERQVAVDFVTGTTTREIAALEGISEETAKSILRRVREKYFLQGRPAPEKTSLMIRLIEDGHLDIQITGELHGMPEKILRIERVGMI